MTARVFVVAALGLLPAVAVADPQADQLQAKGEQLAKDGRFTEAIDAFKQADRIEPRASHACLIALAYTRRELWPQAEIFLDQCHQRANAQDPLPEWVPEAEKLIQERLSSVNVAPVEIATEPQVDGVQLTVSSFAPDEVFGPRTIHLPQGHHTIIARAAGFANARQDIDITDRSARRVVVKLYRPGEEPRPPAPPPPSKVPWILIGTGGALLLGGGLLDATWYKSARDDLDAAPTQAAYDKLESTYDKRRAIVIGFYAAGGAAVITGLVLRYTKYKERPEAAPVVSVEPTAGGGMVSVGWQR